MNLSIISLLISNIIVIILAIIQKWDISTVLWVYWVQSLIIGFFQFLRIFPSKKFHALFFAFHYGFFHFIYAIFLFNFFTARIANTGNILQGAILFFINHLFSFYYNETAGNMFYPYIRIVPMHLIIVFGAFLGQSTLVIFLILKTAADLVTLTIQHRS